MITYSNKLMNFIKVLSKVYNMYIDHDWLIL